MCKFQRIIFLDTGRRSQYRSCIASWHTVPAATEREDKSILKSKVFALSALASLFSLGAVRAVAQTKPAASPAAAEKPSEQFRRGEGLFLQRCSICHLPRKLKFGSPPVIGPSLNGQFRDASPEQMKVLKGFILKGGPDMPGFQYGLDSKEIEDLIEYLKLL